MKNVKWGRAAYHRAEWKGNSMNTTTAERVTDADGTAFEGEIREFIRKDIAPARRISTESSEFAVNSVNSLVQRVAGTSLQEIDNLVVELQKLQAVTVLAESIVFDRLSCSAALSLGKRSATASLMSLR